MSLTVFSERHISCVQGLKSFVEQFVLPLPSLPWIWWIFYLKICPLLRAILMTLMLFY